MVSGNYHITGSKRHKSPKASQTHYMGEMYCVFSSDTFFDLTHFEYADIFDGVKQVWEVFSRLEDYLIMHTLPENCIRGTVHPGAYVMGQHILIEEGAVIEPGSVFKSLASLAVVASP